jgi:aminoglycoside 3-N-acetyltransferase
MIRKALARIRKRCSGYLHPISAHKLRAALDELLPNQVDVLFVHSSLSSCGRFTAGPNDVIDALKDRAASIGFPTHTYCYPAADNAQAPLFDRTTTPSRNGILTELFRQQPGVIRSIHSTHSVAFRGPDASQLCAGHYQCNTPCGEGTPYQRMLECSAAVLMFGITFHAYTLFHTAEDAAGSPFAYEATTIDPLRVLDEQGNLQTCPSKRQSRAPRRFREAGEHLVNLGLVKKIRLGRDHLYLATNSANVHDYLVDRLRVIPDYLYSTCTAPLA